MWQPAVDESHIAGTQGDTLKAVQNLPGIARPPFNGGLIAVWGSPPGDTRVYADGVYIMLAPLAAGVHHISFAGAESGTPVFGAFGENVTYTITVTR